MATPYATSRPVKKALFVGKARELRDREPLISPRGRVKPPAGKFGNWGFMSERLAKACFTPGTADSWSKWWRLTASAACERQKRTPARAARFAPAPA
jgi:hypothetical protein